TSTDLSCSSSQASAWVMASMRVIGVSVMFCSPRATAALSAALVCALDAPFLISSMALLQGDRLGTLGQQVLRRVGIEEIEHRLDRLHRRVEVQVHFLVHAL